MSSAGEKISFQSAKAVISTAATAAMFVRLIARDYVPRELRRYAITKFQQFLSTFSNEATLLIDEYEGLNKNRLFHAAELYIGTIVGPSTMSYRASLLEKEKTVNVSLGGGPDEIVDKFGGIQLKWSLITKEIKPRYVKNLDDYQSTMISETRYLQLTFHKKHKNKVINEYLPYVLERFEAVKENKKPLKLYTLNIDNSSRTHPWQSVNLDHPAKFETLAMDDEMKNMVVDDLDMFLKRKELYRKVGKAWKRGYLLYGPPGTGKSSLVAAMANYLNFDVYDLELSGICSDSLLRKLLITTANRSILVVEDIDASIDLTERRRDRALRLPSSSMYSSHQQLLGPKTVTLSGLLNFIDGLWSSIGDERIIIFTTNHMEKLDPALLRPGRMDVHIHMSYCTPCGFKLLAKNYLGITEHPLVFKAEEMIASSKVTPAEVGEQLLKSEDPVLALNGLIKFLEEKKEEEEKLIGAERVKKSKSSDRVKEVMKIARAEMNGRIIRKDEAADALKTLFGFLEQATGNVDTCDPDSSLRTLAAIQECEETLEI